MGELIMFTTFIFDTPHGPCRIELKRCVARSSRSEKSAAMRWNWRAEWPDWPDWKVGWQVFHRDWTLVDVMRWLDERKPYMRSTTRNSADDLRGIHREAFFGYGQLAGVEE